MGRGFDPLRAGQIDLSHALNVVSAAERLRAPALEREWLPLLFDAAGHLRELL